MGDSGQIWKIAAPHCRYKISERVIQMIDDRKSDLKKVGL